VRTRTISARGAAPSRCATGRAPAPASRSPEPLSRARRVAAPLYFLGLFCPPLARACSSATRYAAARTTCGSRGRQRASRPSTSRG
jgi:hypothetical protein